MKWDTIVVTFKRAGNNKWIVVEGTVAVELPKHITEALLILSDEGWEPVSTAYYFSDSSGSLEKHVMTFKRPRPDEK